jgi:hypothetical protein
VQGLVAEITVEGLYKEDSLGIMGGDLLHLAGIDKFEPYGIERGVGIVLQKLLY